MKQKKLILLLFVLLLTVLLCACSENESIPQNERDYSVSLPTSVGTGYYWDCVLSDSDIVSVKSTQNPAADSSPGSTYMTDFLFSGKKRGSCTATLSCRRSWDDSIIYFYTCELKVDREKVVTGELSSQMARIHPGEGLYNLAASDTSVALWTSEDDGSYVFTPLRDGATSLTFTPYDESASDRVFYLNVSQEGLITITEDTGLKNAESYQTPQQLEQRLGFSMDLPETCVINEISSVDSMGCIRFEWNDNEFVYVGGDFDLDAFPGPGTNVIAVGGHKVTTQTLLYTMAAWENDGKVFCITGEQAIPSEDLLQLLREILDEQPQTGK